jgi:hypothetical protein
MTSAERLLYASMPLRLAPRFSPVLLAVGLAASLQSAFFVEGRRAQASARLPLKRYIRSADIYRQTLY